MKCKHNMSIVTNAAVGPGSVFFSFMSRRCLAAITWQIRMCMLASWLQPLPVCWLDGPCALSSRVAASKEFGCPMGIMGSVGMREEQCSSN